MKKTTAAVIIAAVILGASAVALTARSGGGAPSAAGIPTANVRVGPFQRTVFSVGSLSAANSATVTAPISGKITKLLPEGTRVESGDPIIWFDTTDFEKELKDQRDQLDLARKDLESAQEEYRLTELKNSFEMDSSKTKTELAEQQLRDARQKHDQERVLVERNISPKSKLEEAYLTQVQAELSLRNSRIDLRKAEENAQSNLRIARKKIERKQLEIAAYEKRVRELEEKLGNAVLRAPSAGDLSYVMNWRNGNMSKISEGEQVFERTELAEIPDTAQMIAVVPVHELEIASVQRGQKATISVEAFPDRVYQGEVVNKAVMATSNQQNSRRWWGGTQGDSPREFEVRIRVDGSDGSLRHGMTASASILVNALDSATQVPLDAIVRRDGQPGVVTAPDKAFVPVELVASNDNFAAIKADIRDGSKVFLRDPAEVLGDTVGTGQAPPARAAAAPPQQPAAQGTTGAAEGGRPQRPARESRPAAQGSTGEAPAGTQGTAEPRRRLPSPPAERAKPQ